MSKVMTNRTEFTFMCTRCGEKAAVVKQGRKVFLCAVCASDAMWHDMVGVIINGPDAAREDDGGRQS
ncbi:hypothetical protein BMS3Abin02_00087 [bacterium BMS3Abin02]|nr:hypothetical protein BMS3Abin02_00087 [bacterium BMS3Abin02]GBE21941.1 hypothetical protein BMS3Bbin01_01295 [bacterium BMS3Bbin01]